MKIITNKFLEEVLREKVNSGSFILDEKATDVTFHTVSESDVDELKGSAKEIKEYLKIDDDVIKIECNVHFIANSIRHEENDYLNTKNENNKERVVLTIEGGFDKKLTPEEITTIKKMSSLQAEYGIMTNEASAISFSVKYSIAKKDGTVVEPTATYLLSPAKVKAKQDYLKSDSFNTLTELFEEIKLQSSVKKYTRDTFKTELLKDIVNDCVYNINLVHAKIENLNILVYPYTDEQIGDYIPNSKSVSADYIDDYKAEIKRAIENKEHFMVITLLNRNQNLGPIECEPIREDIQELLDTMNDDVSDSRNVTLIMVDKSIPSGILKNLEKTHFDFRKIENIKVFEFQERYVKNSFITALVEYIRS